MSAAEAHDEEPSLEDIDADRESAAALAAAPDSAEPPGLPPSPDERVFRAHLERAEFVAGLGERRWRLVSLDWPTAMFAVSAAPREGSPNEFFLRLDLSDYPRQAPNGYPWDIDEDVALTEALRPKGDRVGFAFRADYAGLYIPVDRSGLESHPAWRTWRWNDSKDITFYLRLVYELLNDDDYTGI